MKEKERLKTLRGSISELHRHINEDYVFLSSEFKQIDKMYTPSDDDFPFVCELELYIIGIAGYASQIADNGRVRQKLREAIDHLQRLDFFSNAMFQKIFVEDSFDAPLLRAYLLHLDELRRAVLEYLQTK